jgi:rhodanese-related sulfurtransferase
MIRFFRSLFTAAPKSDFKAMVEAGALVVDVRTPEEFQSGSVPGAINIPLQLIGSRVNQLKKPGKPVITICRSGARSKMAAGMLRKAGIEAYNGGPWQVLLQKTKQ